MALFRALTRLIHTGGLIPKQGFMRLFDIPRPKARKNQANKKPRACRDSKALYSSVLKCQPPHLALVLCTLYPNTMQELYSRALVLGRSDVNEVDGMIVFFTEQYGRISARAKSIRKPTSKLSAHLQPLSFVKVRCIRRAGPRDGFGIIDALYDEDMESFQTRRRYDLIPFINFLITATFDFQKDQQLWHFLVNIFQKNYDPVDVARAILKLFGIWDDRALCAQCKKSPVHVFHIQQEKFFCSSCSSQFHSQDVLHIA